MNKSMIMDHPLIVHKISLLRSKDTGTKEFRELVTEVSMLMCYEATRDLPLKDIDIETPVAYAKTRIVSGRKLAIIPILRAGLGMVDGVLKLLPAAKIGHLGIYRDPQTLDAVDYYCKLPSDINSREVIVLDPMLATGHSAIDAINTLKEKGVTSIKFMCIIAARQGLELLNETHPDVQVYVGALDEKLNDHSYIVPGLGDAGDRIFGTK
jgi:uracil phosphoribosyltransferase